MKELKKKRIGRCEFFCRRENKNKIIQYVAFFVFRAPDLADQEMQSKDE